MMPGMPNASTRSAHDVSAFRRRCHACRPARRPRSGIDQTGSGLTPQPAKSSFAADTLNDVFDTCAQEWDFLTGTLIPSISARFAQEIYPVRLTVANILLKAYNEGDSESRMKLADVVALRLGRLMTFCEFPSDSSAKISRLQCIDFLFQSQKQARGIEQRPF